MEYITCFNARINTIMAVVGIIISFNMIDNFLIVTVLTVEWGRYVRRRRTK